MDMMREISTLIIGGVTDVVGSHGFGRKLVWLAVRLFQCRMFGEIGF